MAFTNLEKKYNQTVNKLYKGDRTKFNDGKPSVGLNDDPLITRRRGDGYFGAASRALGRAIPVSSAFQDVKRLTLFTLSVRGITFLVKQQLLQTGNTFEQTRLINPLFAIGNAVPFLHLRRHLRPITGGPGGALLKKTDVSYANVRKLGQLQKSTYDGFTQNAGGGIGAFFKKLAGPITSTISALTAKKNVGEDFGYGTPTSPEGWGKSRPELGKADKDYVVGFNAPLFKFGGAINTTSFTGQRYGAIPSSVGNWSGKYTTYLRLTNEERSWSYQHIGYTDYTKDFAKARPDRGLDYIPLDDGESVVGDDPRTSVLAEDVSNTGVLNLYEDATFYTKNQVFENQKKYVEMESAWLQEATNNDEERIPFLKYFSSDVEVISGERQVDESTGAVFSQNAKYFAQNRSDLSKRISYIKDPFNETSPNSSENILRPYRNIRNDDTLEDAINISIAMGNDDPLRFRAFIKDLQQTASPEYKNYQYIGRTEKFISYVTVQREISFKLGVLAFSKDELSIVWKRINYLTGLVYPYGINRGILQPNIIRLTIGNVYVNQPGYLTGLSTNFNEISESWDIDRGVPHGAQMDMKFVLIEKKSRIASSPFYGITEQMSGSAGFAQSIEAR